MHEIKFLTSQDNQGDWKDGLCVSALFSGYLSTLNSRQSDVQALLSDTYMTLDSNSGILYLYMYIHIPIGFISIG